MPPRARTAAASRLMLGQMLFAVSTSATKKFCMSITTRAVFDGSNLSKTWRRPRLAMMRSIT